MEKIYNDVQDLQVRNYVAYAKAADGKLYIDPEFKTQVTQVELEDAFKKGALLIADGDNYLVPINLNANKVFTLAKTGNPTVEFDAAKTYAVGDCVTKSGKAYKCKTAIASAAAWDASKWDEIITVDFVAWAAKASA